MQENGDQIEGYPLSPDDGAALKDMLSISKQEWALKLAQGDPVLHVHIPREGSFTAEDCYESFGRARDFFAKYYPDWPYTAVACVSWLMDPQLRELLSESSNLVKFQAWYRPFPVKSGDESIYTFVFRSEKREIEQLPETTSLHKKMKTFMKEGGRFRLGGGFILPDDLEADKLSRKLQELE